MTAIRPKSRRRRLTALAAVVVFVGAGCTGEPSADDATSTAPPATAAPPTSTAKREASDTTAAEEPATTATSAAEEARDTTATAEPATTATAATDAAQDGASSQSADAKFFADFSTPEDFYDRFVRDVHHRDSDGPNTEVTWSGDHNHACEGPETTREVSAADEEDLFWWCAPKGPESGHIMTSMGDVDGYSILSFAPDQSFSDVDRICWDVNLTNLGGRKWFQALIVPEAAFQANERRLDYISPVTQDVDEFAVPLPPGSFMFQWWDHAFRIYNPEQVLEDMQVFLTDDKAKRYKHCMVDNGDGTITITQERDDGDHVQTVEGSFPDEGRVIFQEDNYTPLKDGPIAGFTWHWDNIEIG